FCPLDSHRLAEVQKDLEPGCSCRVVELKTERAHPIEMPRLFHGKGGTQFLPPNVHVKTGSLHVEKRACFAESAELACHLNRGTAIRDNDPHAPEILETADQFFPVAYVQFNSPVWRKGPDNISLRNTQAMG